ncbi:hypothetical protein GCM10023328_20960 [Modestobacter marinus]|uniref:Uncharacterized protein n=1 Tax=Modestobacter marinus TaxID=477641 RepID=A0ABQ2FYJ1_9ACTN|nr:hypothetical protein GCM10011589_23170 [Modestobacter marinus]
MGPPLSDVGRPLRRKAPEVRGANPAPACAVRHNVAALVQDTKQKSARIRAERRTVSGTPDDGQDVEGGPAAVVRSVSIQARRTDDQSPARKSVAGRPGPRVRSGTDVPGPRSSDMGGSGDISG